MAQFYCPFLDQFTWPLTSRNGYVLLDKRLFLPKQWFDDEYADKRKECDVPEKLEFQSKPQLAADMLLALYKENIIPFEYILEFSKNSS